MTKIMLYGPDNKLNCSMAKTMKLRLVLFDPECKMLLQEVTAECKHNGNDCLRY